MEPESPSLAAGAPPISTVPDPLAIVSGGPTQTAGSPTRAEGRLQISTVGQPGPAIGPPTCGTGPVNAGHACQGGRAFNITMFAEKATVSVG